MIYDELNSSWKTQRERYQLWEIRLLHYAKQLRDYFEERLSPPATSWINYQTKEEHNYIELVDFFGEAKPTRKNPSNTSITPDGFLAFGISITFDHGPDTYPKQNIFVPIAIRYNGQKLEHAFYDMDSNSVSEAWTADKDAFYAMFSKRLHDYLSHDPHDGFGQKKKGIGFLADR